MTKCLTPRRTRRYYDNLIRFRLERVILLFGEKEEQRLTDLMLVLNIDRSGTFQFMSKLVARNFIQHVKGGKYVLPRAPTGDVACIELDWLYSQPTLFFCGYQEGAIFGWWADPNDLEAEPKAWLGTYVDWAGKSYLPIQAEEVLPWSMRLGSAMRRVIRWFCRVSKSRSAGSRP